MKLFRAVKGLRRENRMSNQESRRELRIYMKFVNNSVQENWKEYFEGPYNSVPQQILIYRTAKRLVYLQLSSLVFGKLPVRFSAGMQAILYEDFRGFPHSLQENDGKAPRLDRSRFLPNAFQPIHLQTQHPTVYRLHTKTSSLSN
jgi:hypothetical protein